MSIPFCNSVVVDSTERGKRRRPDAAFGARLRAARESKGLTQADVAERLDVSWQTVSNWETGQRTPGADYLFDLAALYEESPTYLLKGRRPRTLDEHPLGEELTKRVLELPQERQERVLRAFIDLVAREDPEAGSSPGRQ